MNSWVSALREQLECKNGIPSGYESFTEKMWLEHRDLEYIGLCIYISGVVLNVCARLMDAPST